MTQTFSVQFFDAFNLIPGQDAPRGFPRLASLDLCDRSEVDAVLAGESEIGLLACPDFLDLIDRQVPRRQFVAGSVLIGFKPILAGRFPR
jgi:hypothetical protein